jgi:hypothetical protein
MSVCKLVGDRALTGAKQWGKRVYATLVGKQESMSAAERQG